MKGKKAESTLGQYA